jgi:hypothetical protein
MKHRLAVLVGATFAVAACSETPTAPVTDANAVSSVVAGSDVIPGRFIVTLREGASPAAVAAEHRITPDYVYSAALNGFAGVHVGGGAQRAAA